MVVSKPQRVWTVAEAKAKLSEILRLAETEGPQRIGARRPFIVVPAEAWDAKPQPPGKEPMPLGKWLVENTPRGADLEIPRSRSSSRKIPFIDYDVE